MIEFTWPQLQLIAHAWGVDTMRRKPTARADRIIDFRHISTRDFDFARVALVTSHKATCGCNLYRVTFRNEARP